MSFARATAVTTLMLVTGVPSFACTGDDPAIIARDDAPDGGTRPAGAGFTLRELSTIVLSPNETLNVPVEIERKDAFAGAVKIVVQPLAEGLSAAPLTLPGGETKAEIVLTATSSAKPAVTRVQVVATADPAFADTKEVPFVVRGAAGTRELTYGENDGASIIQDVAPIAHASTADGGVVIASQEAVVRVRADGKPDTAFGDAGKTTLKQPASRTVAVRVAADGKIFVFTYKNDRTSFAVHRLSPNGAYDTSYGAEGVASHPFAKPSDQPYMLGGDVDASGRAVAAIVPGLDGTTLFVRFLADGAADSAFAGQDLKTTAGSWTEMRLHGETPIVFGGAFYDGASMMLKFATAVVTTSPSPPLQLPGEFNNLELATATFDAQGRMLVAGHGTYTGGQVTSQGVLLRVNANGTPDTTLDDSGIVYDTLGDDNSYASFMVALDDGGKTIAIGNRSTDVPPKKHALVRYDARGRRDPTFGTGGLVLDEVPGAELTMGGYLQAVPTVVVVRAYDPSATMLTRYWR